MAAETLGDVLRRIGRLAGLQGVLSLTDAQLLERFATRRDEPAFAALMVRHGPMVLGVCRRLLRDADQAEDAFQASFLVLARKAGSIQRRPMLSAWLYGVTYKVAVRLRSRAWRRQARETQGVDLASVAAAIEPDSSDLPPLLHQEVQRLPDKYRNPIVLCYLEGKTHEEAALLLRWPLGTVKGRLARARDLLRSRLSRRGVTASEGMMATVLAATPVTAQARLTDTTIHAATRFAAGEAAAGGLASARAVALTQGVLRTMMLTKLKITAALALAVALFGGAGGLAYHSWAAAPADAPKGAAREEKPPAADPPKDDATKEKSKDDADAEKIRGTWATVWDETGGKLAPSETIKNLSLLITADKITFNPGGENRQSTYKLDPTKTPKGIELTPQEGPAKGKTLRGLYELDGDRLKLCVQNGEGEEPKEFTTKPGTGWRLLVLRRKKDQGNDRSMAEISKAIHEEMQAANKKAAEKAADFEYPNAKKLEQHDGSLGVSEAGSIYVALYATTEDVSKVVRWYDKKLAGLVAGQPAGATGDPDGLRIAINQDGDRNELGAIANRPMSTRCYLVRATEYTVSVVISRPPGEALTVISLTYMPE